MSGPGPGAPDGPGAPGDGADPEPSAPGAAAGVPAPAVADGAPGTGFDAGRGVRIGVDVGEVRVGVAASDPDGVLASRVSTLRRDRRGGRDLAGIARIVTERGAVEVIVGLPRSLSGQEGRAAEAAREYAAAVAGRVAPVPVRLADERLTTVTAERVLAGQGVRGRGRRAVVDQEAAVQILQAYLEARRAASARAAAE